MNHKDTYKTAENRSEGLFKDKGSKFISYLFPIHSESEVKDILATIKKEHFSARHHCYAYRLGNFGETYRTNDDGEPSGTAGKPIHGQLLSNELTNVLIVVVRYFGGTLLGVSGLINAYKNAAADAISNASIITCIIKDQYQLRFDYPLQNTVMKIVKDEQLDVVNAEFGIDCKLTVSVRTTKSTTTQEKFGSILGLSVEKLDK